MTFDSADMRGFATRRLRYAVVASLVLHLLILWPDTSRLLTKDAFLQLQATLRKSPESPASGSPASGGLPAPREELPHRTTPAPASPGFATPLLELAGTRSVPQTHAVPPEPVTGPAIRTVPDGYAAVLPVAPETSETQGVLLTEANAPRAAADGLRGYRLTLATQARRFRQYPAEAVASGLTGSTDVRLEVGGDGQPRAATMVRSSGHELLDQAALAMIDAGAAHARLPESLRGKPFAVVLPVVFNLPGE
jgi:protein TonB